MPLEMLVKKLGTWKAEEILQGDRAGVTATTEANDRSVIDHSFNDHVVLPAASGNSRRVWLKYGTANIPDSDLFRMRFAVFYKMIFQHILRNRNYMGVQPERGRSGGLVFKIPFSDAEYAQVINPASDLHDLHGPNRRLNFICINTNATGNQIISIMPEFDA